MRVAKERPPPRSTFRRATRRLPFRSFDRPGRTVPCNPGAGAFSSSDGNQTVCGSSLCASLLLTLDAVIFDVSSGEGTWPARSLRSRGSRNSVASFDRSIANRLGAAGKVDCRWSFNAKSRRCWAHSCWTLFGATFRLSLCTAAKHSNEDEVGPSVKTLDQGTS